MCYKLSFFLFICNGKSVKVVSYWAVSLCFVSIIFSLNDQLQHLATKLFSLHSGRDEAVKSPQHDMQGTHLASTTERDSYSSSSAPSLLSDVSFLGHPVLAWRGFPLCHRSRGRGRRERQQIMDTQSQLSQGETVAWLTREWLSVWLLTSRLWTAPALRGYITVMNCEAIMRRGIMPKA